MAAIDDILQKCQHAQIAARLVNARDNPDDFPGQASLFPEMRRALKIDVPEGRDFQTLRVPDGPVAEFVAGTQFHLYKRISGYDGIWSPSEGVIECLVDSETFAPPRGAPAILRRVRQAFRDPVEATPPEPPNRTDDEAPIVLPFPEDGVVVELRISSDELAVHLDRVRAYNPFPADPPRAAAPVAVPRSPSLRIAGLAIAHHDDAVDLLRKVGNALLFQIDIIARIPIKLRTPERRRFQPRPQKLGPMPMPELDLDHEPMELYWYARVASYPLLRFLAFYQVLEYFFPMYTEREVQNAARQVLRVPGFDATRDKDITRLLSAVRLAAGGRAFGDERSQLLAVVRACVNADELREFLRQDPERLQYFSDKEKRWKKIADQQLVVESPQLLDQVSERIYRIRCRIVHTKLAQDELPLLLPFSRDAQLLVFDVDVVEFVAVRVLCFGARSLSLPARFVRSGSSGGPPASEESE